MPGARQGNRRKDRDTFDSKPLQRIRQPAKQPEKEKPTERTPHAKPVPEKQKEDTDSGPINLSTTIPLPIQQLLLDVFKTALLTTPTDPHASPETQPNARPPATPLDTKTLVQTIKSHLYQRDFDSAFAEAGEELLRAYALRWSAARALGYAGIFKAVLGWMRSGEGGEEKNLSLSRCLGDGDGTRVVCIGGGAGAEIVALAAVWRDLRDDGDGDGGIAKLEDDVAGVSLDEKGKEMEREKADGEGDESVAEQSDSQKTAGLSPKLSVTAVDIADWSIVVERLAKTISSPDVPAQKTSKYHPPLLSESHGATGLDISFARKDVLGLPESDLKDLILGNEQTTPTSTPTSLLVTLMFTLNELFTTSMPKTTALLLNMTEILPVDAVLLVVDSPGSYSTLKLGKAKDGAAQERQYPMKFLLDHTLLSVAKGKWERVLTQDSRWWRRDAARLRYEVGEGAGLEDMRYQLHVYRRV
jgi:25S rRNA (uracil2843-N3)-methyltransferase